MGRPTELAEVLGLPGSLKSTNRFINSVRAATVSLEKDSVLRVVRSFLKATSSCEHAATRTSRSAEAGPATTAAGGACISVPRELDSCAAQSPANTKAPASKRHCPLLISILRLRQNLRKLRSELRARHHLLESRGFRLRGKVRLHVRKKSNHRQFRLLLLQPLHSLQRHVPRI